MCCDTRMNTTHTYARIHIHPCACAHMHTYTIYSSLFLPALPTGCISSICCSPHHAWLSYTWAHFPSIFQVTVGIWMLGLRTKTKRRIQISTPPAPRYLLIIGFFFFTFKFCSCPLPVSFFPLQTWDWPKRTHMSNNWTSQVPSYSTVCKYCSVKFFFGKSYLE